MQAPLSQPTDFLERIAESVYQPEPTVIIAESRFGTPYVFEQLSTTRAMCIWVQLTPEDEGDEVAQGNRLSDATSRALEGQLFGHGMAYTYGLAVLRQHLSLFEPLTLILSGADHGQRLATDLLDFQSPGCQVVIAFERLPDDFLIPERAHILLEHDLQVRDDEALVLSRERLGDTQSLNLLRLSGGAYESYVLGLHRQLNLPPPLRPSPNGASLPPDAQPSIDPGVLLTVFTRREQYLEALEVACEHLPKRAPELLPKAGEAYLERGLYDRLWTLLGRLPEALQNEERVLTWQARSARRLGHHQALRPRIEAFLAEHEAPDLRALYASFIARERAFAEVERAYQAAQTPTTLQHYGLALVYRDPEKSMGIFRSLIDLTRREGSPSEQIRATMMMALPLALMGRYRESMAWLEEAITRFDEHGVGDWQARMHMINNWAYTRILIGETVGLGERLAAEAEALKDAYPARTLSFRATLGDYHLSQGRPEQALSHYEDNLAILERSGDTRSIDFPPNIVRDIVHCLLHLGELERAGTLATRHYYLSRESRGFDKIYGTLAHGMVLALSDPEKAIAPLQDAADALEAAFLGDHLVSACFYLAKAQLSLRRDAEARATLKRCQSRLNELSDTGFRLLAGPEADFGDVAALFRADDAPLQLNLLGPGSVSLGGKTIKLYPQWLDVLALLALHPEGLTGEQLLILLYEDEGRIGTLKSTLSKLRRSIPLTRPPYRIDLPYRADFLTVEQHLKSGRIRAGLELYRGPLLPTSYAPGILEQRDLLEESLRQAVLQSGDPEALISLSERLGDDPELWEAALDALPQGDPRTSVASAKLKKLLESW